MLFYCIVFLQFYVNILCIVAFPIHMNNKVVICLYIQVSSYKKRKQMETQDYEKWKSSVLTSNKQDKKEGTETVLALFLYHVSVKDLRQLILFFL